MLFYITYLQYAILLTCKHYLLHTTLHTYKTLHKITQLLIIIYISYLHHLQCITLPHLQYIMLHYLVTISYITYLHESLALDLTHDIWKNRNN